MRSFLENQKTDLIQKAAWRVVRSAQDRFKNGDGSERMAWAIDRMHAQFPKESKDRLEDYLRAAYINFTIETGEYHKGGFKI